MSTLREESGVFKGGRRGRNIYLIGFFPEKQHKTLTSISLCLEEGGEGGGGGGGKLLAFSSLSTKKKNR